MKNRFEQVNNWFGLARLNASKIIVCAMVAALLSSGLLLRAGANSGDLDTSFGQGGKVATDFFGQADYSARMVTQPDGRIVVVGYAVSNTTLIAVARYNSNGTLDTSFGVGGKVTTPIGLSSFAQAVALQTDGRIVVGGSSFLTSDGLSVDFAIARYNSNGSLDTSFGTGGIVTTDFSGVQDSISDIAIRPDGRIIASGYSFQSFALAQYTSNGSLDAGFGIGGKVTTDFASVGGGIVQSRAMLLQADGRVVVVGCDYTVNDFALARYNSDGNLDNTFGTGGKVLTDFFNHQDDAYRIVIQPDGRYVVVGTAQQTSASASHDFALARYNPDGSLDTFFGTGGKVTADLRGGSDYAIAVALLSNGRILVGGQSVLGVNTQTSDFALARFNSNGSSDPTFGTSGKLLTDFFGGNDYITDIAIQPNGSYLAVGLATFSATSFSDFALARYTGDLTFDICVQDDATQTYLKFNSQTGDYYFQNCKKGIIRSGKGNVSHSGCNLDLIDTGADSKSDRYLTAHVNLCTHSGNASVQIAQPGSTTTISDINIDNNTAACH